jgi:hypothetical protein
MENNINQRLLGGASEASVFHACTGGWKLSNGSPLPVEGEIFFLTFPFIDQAITLETIWLRVQLGCYAKCRDSYRKIASSRRSRMVR